MQAYAETQHPCTHSNPLNEPFQQPQNLVFPIEGYQALSVSPHWAFVPTGGNHCEELRVCMPVIMAPLLSSHESCAKAVALGLFCQYTQNNMLLHTNTKQSDSPRDISAG